MARPKQEAMRERLTLLDPSKWYTPANRSEHTTLAFMRRRGVVEHLVSNGGFVYRLSRPELDLGRFGADVVPLESKRG